MSGQTTTDFTHEWANRHDVGCERREPVPLGCLDNRACHCYRRWLEGRLGETRGALAVFTDHYVRMINSGDCGSWDPETEDVVKLARKALLPPKGAGDE